MAEQKLTEEHLRVLKRLNTRIYGHEDSAPDEETKNIYKCFVGPSDYFEGGMSVGYFVLSAQRLYFMVDYPFSRKNRGNHYSYASTSIRNIGTVCASYDKPFNIVAFVFGIILSILSLAVTAYILADGGLESWQQFIPLVLFGGMGALFIYSAFKFRKRNYKITIGDITIMGGTAGRGRRTSMFTGNTTIVYNAIPIEENFYEFVEVINGRIATLQERGDYA